MEFQDRYFHTGEIMLHYLAGPKSGPPLVLIHGATGGSNEWGALQYDLVKDWQVFILEQRGHGLSGHAGSPDGYHATDNIRDMLAFLSEVVQAPAVVWGHSWGAIIAMLGAGEAKDHLRAVVLEDPPIGVRNEIEPQLNPFISYFSWCLQTKEEIHSLEELKDKLRVNNPDIPDLVLEGWASNLFHLDCDFLRMLLTGPGIVAGIDFADAIRTADLPVLLMRADPAMGAALVQEDLDFVLANNPNFQLVQFPGAGHGIHNDQTQKTLEVFRAFAAQLPS